MRIAIGPPTATRLTRASAFFSFLLLLAGTLAASAAPPSPGELAPPFRFVGVDGAVYESAGPFGAGKEGQAVVIAWFPKAFTPG